MDTVRYIDVTKVQLARGTINKNIGANMWVNSPSSKDWVLKLFMKLLQNIKFVCLGLPDDTGQDSANNEDHVNNSEAYQQLVKCFFEFLLIQD